MSGFKSLTDEDVQRIERGITYTVRSISQGQKINVVGELGDLANQIIIPRRPDLDYESELAEALKIGALRILFWFCCRFDEMACKSTISGISGWRIVDGLPVAPVHVRRTPGTADYEHAQQSDDFHPEIKS